MLGLTIFMRYFSSLICFRILIRNKKISVKEVMLLAGIIILVNHMATIIYPSISSVGWKPLATWVPFARWIAPIVDSTLLMLLTIFATKKGYVLKKAIILAFLALTITTAAEGIIILLISSLHPFNIIPLLLILLITPCSSLIFIRVTKEVRSKINQSEEIQTILRNILIFLAVITHLAFPIFFPLQPDQSVLDIISFILFGCLIVTGFNFLIYARSIDNKYQIQRKKDEHEAMQYYMGEIEKQYTDMRKFKHDYQNILLSIDQYIIGRDFDGLESYFQNQVKTVSKKIVKQDFMLENLGKVKVKEIKSILVAKLVRAQEQGITINFDAREDIEIIPINTVVLVRMLGIILDNAIEELLELKQGILQVGIWNENAGVTFVVQNTCRSDIPKLYELKKAGFSTKAENRGLGLSNLVELAEEESNILLQTMISNNQFIQEIAIIEE